MRKIIQITGEITGDEDSLVALCDDGTLWIRTDSKGTWKEIDTSNINK